MNLVEVLDLKKKVQKKENVSIYLAAVRIAKRLLSINVASFID